MAEEFREISHFHGDGVFGYSYQSITRPRLTFTDTCIRKTRSTERQWFVDHDAVEPDEIEARLATEPVFSDEEKAILAQLTHEWADRSRQREIGLQALLMLGRRGAVEWQDGKVRLFPADEDDGCPKGDPECLGGNGDCHDACSTFAEREASQ